MTPDDPTEERWTHATPAGGVSSICYYRDADGNPAPKSKAVAGEIHELDAAGNSIARTYFERKPTPER
jgi:hypothetical protein